MKKLLFFFCFATLLLLLAGSGWAATSYGCLIVSAHGHGSVLGGNASCGSCSTWGWTADGTYSKNILVKGNSSISISGQDLAAPISTGETYFVYRETSETSSAWNDPGIVTTHGAICHVLSDPNNRIVGSVQCGNTSCVGGVGVEQSGYYSIRPCRVNHWCTSRLTANYTLGPGPGVEECYEGDTTRCAPGIENAYQICEPVYGYYEWGEEQYCPDGQVCSGDGECIVPTPPTTCTDECSPKGKKECVGGEGTTKYKVCNTYFDPPGFEDSCLEWSDSIGVYYDCPIGSICESAECTESCDECLEGSKRCYGSKSRQLCEDPDNDGCFTWGVVESCPADEVECNPEGTGYTSTTYSCDAGSCSGSESFTACEGAYDTDAGNDPENPGLCAQPAGCLEGVGCEYGEFEDYCIVEGGTELVEYYADGGICAFETIEVTECFTDEDDRGWGEPTNGPSITDFEVTPTVVAPGETVIVYITASDPHYDTLSLECSWVKQGEVFATDAFSCEIVTGSEESCEGIAPEILEASEVFNLQCMVINTEALFDEAEEEIEVRQIVEGDVLWLRTFELSALVIDPLERPDMEIEVENMLSQPVDFTANIQVYDLEDNPLFTEPVEICQPPLVCSIEGDGLFSETASIVFPAGVLSAFKNYKIVLEVVDGEDEQVLSNNTATAFFAVQEGGADGEAQGVSVPETDLMLLPLIVLSVLFIIYLKR